MGDLKDVKMRLLEETIGNIEELSELIGEDVKAIVISKSIESVLYLVKELKKGNKLILIDKNTGERSNITLIDD